MDSRYLELKERLAEVWDIGKSASILAWDQQTKMPPGGARGRAEQLATLGRIAHHTCPDPGVGRLLAAPKGFEDSQPSDPAGGSLDRVTRHDWEKARPV